MSESIVVHLVLIYLSSQFTSFKISYNTQKEKWILNKLIISMCVRRREIKARDI